MNKIVAVALLSTVFAAPAFAEDTSSMADIMHAPPAMMVPAHMPGQAPEDPKGDSDSAEHGMGNHQMMGREEDDCDSWHGNGGHHKNGMNEDDCDSKHARDDHYGYGMGEFSGMGMMGGYAGHGMGGPGYGIMGGQGAGMMMEPNMRLLGALDLSKEQQAKINKIADKLKHDNWATQGLLNDETAKLRDLYEAEKRDPAAIGKEYQKVFDLKRKMIETYLEAQNRIEDVLTPDQLHVMKDARTAMRHMYEQMQ